MLRKIVLAGFTMAVFVGISLSEEIRGVILKVDGNKVTFAEVIKKGEKGPEQTLPTTSDVKVMKGMYNKDTKKVEAGDAIEGGLKHKMFADIGEKGVQATIVTDADKKNITQILVGGKGKKKNQ
jgi:hypothetical protein